MLDRFARGPIVLVAVALWLLASGAFFALGPYQDLIRAGNGQPLLEERFQAAPEAAGEWLEAIGPEARTDYALFQRLDAGIALLTALALALVIAWTWGRMTREGSLWRWLVVLPLAAGGLELVENGLLLSALGAFPDVPGNRLAMVSLVTSTKLVLMPLVLISAISGLLFLTVRWFRTRRQSSS